MSYSSIEKNSQRYKIAEYGKELNGSIVYLDGPKAECTIDLLKHGIAKDRLKPINRDAACCGSIFKLTDVNAFKINIEDVIHQCNNVAVVWLDMEQQSIDTQVIIDATKTLVPSGVIALTLTFAHLKGGRQELNNTIIGQFKASGLSLDGITNYKGKSGVMNMTIAFGVYKHNKTMVKHIYHTYKCESNFMNDDDAFISLSDKDEPKFATFANTVQCDGISNDSTAIRSVERTPMKECNSNPSTDSRTNNGTEKKVDALLGTIIYLQKAQTMVRVVDIDGLYTCKANCAFVLQKDDGNKYASHTLREPHESGAGSTIYTLPTDEQIATFMSREDHFEKVRLQNAQIAAKKKEAYIEEQEKKKVATEATKKRKREEAKAKRSESKIGLPIYFVGIEPGKTEQRLYAACRHYKGGFAIAYTNSTSLNENLADTSFIPRITHEHKKWFIPQYSRHLIEGDNFWACERQNRQMWKLCEFVYNGNDGNVTHLDIEDAKIQYDEWTGMNALITKVPDTTVKDWKGDDWKTDIAAYYCILDDDWE